MLIGMILTPRRAATTREGVLIRLFVDGEPEKPDSPVKGAFRSSKARDFQWINILATTSFRSNHRGRLA